jgi:transcriptional regulator of acetoin/glycerol metabolism
MMHKRGAWEKFHTGNEPTDLREDILTSWRRSRLSGVSPHSVDFPRADIDVESRFARIAIPLMNEMAELLAGTETCLAMANASANVLWRWAPDSHLRTALDKAGLLVGHSFDEEHIGTNAVGTSLEIGRTAAIRAEEHFRESFHRFNCVATPVIDPITRRALGTINLTWPPGSTEETFAPIVQKMAKEIQAALKEAAGSRERRLLQEFLDAKAKCAHPVVALNSELIIGNHFAADPHFRHDLLWGRVLDSVGDGGSAQIESPDGTTATVRAIFDSRSIVGAVLVFDSPGPGNEPLTASPRPAAVRASLTDTLAALVQDGRRVVLRGEAGVGKKHALAKAFGAGGVTVLDGSHLMHDSFDQWFRMLRRRLESPTPLIITHLNDLDAKAVRGVASAIAAATNPPPLAATVTLDPKRPVDIWTPILDALDATVLDMGPLRSRLDEIAALATGFAEGQSVSGAAIAELQKYAWPGNIAELRQALRSAVAQSDGACVRSEDLPEHVRDSVWGRRHLSLLERAEAEVITRVLSDCNGNKTVAAKELGVSRPTLYAKIRAYRISSPTAGRDARVGAR